MKLVIDAMGGDYAPKAPVEGALLALEKFPSLSLVLTGPEETVRELLSGKTYDKNRLEIRNCTEQIENEEHSPVEAVRKKKDSSMVVGLSMIKKGEADGLVSAGNTGALLAGATLVAGRIPGVFRPALTVALPTGTLPTLVLDVGANMDAKPAYLHQFAKMSEIYYRHLYGVEKPKVALLNVGVEPGKGNQLAKDAFELLSQDEALCFEGNIEAREILSGEYQIVVTEGFSGNVMLKTLEGVAAYIFTSLKEALMSGFLSKVGALLAKPAMMDLKNRLDPRSVGGSPLLGTNGAVVKAHGNSRAEAFLGAIDQCMRFIETGINEEIKAAFAKGEPSDE